jgi:hypothetical protein
MGKGSPVTADSARKVVAATTTTTGVVPLGIWGGRFNVAFGGDATGVTAFIARSFDGGVTYARIALGGTPVTFANPVTESVQEIEDGVLYGVDVSAISGGTLTIRASQ